MKRQVLAVLAVAIFFGAASAPAASSAHYQLRSSVLSGGGGRAGSASYRLVGVVGQSTPIGVSASGAYTLKAGFIHTLDWSAYPTVPVGALHLLLLTPAPAPPL